MASYISTTNILDILNSHFIPNGSHTFTVNGVNFGTNAVRVKNIYTNANYTSQTDINTLFDDLDADDTYLCVRIFHGALTVGSNVTLRPTRRVKSMFMLCKGILTNNGIISMTGCGANATGQDVYFATINGINTMIGTGGGLETNSVSRTSSTIQYAGGGDGTAGTGRLGGGGGGGGLFMTPGGTSFTVVSGKGSKATSWSGGGGGGGVSIAGGSYTTATSDANPLTAAGGNGRARTIATSNNRNAGGGAGSVGGAGQEALTTNTTTQAGYDVAGNIGTTGAGGTLFLVCYNRLINNNIIESNGLTSNLDTIPSNAATGGASGGGSINILLRRGTDASVYTAGTRRALGGTAVQRNISGNDISGGDGAAGFVQTNALTGFTLRQSMFVKNGDFHWFNGTDWIPVTTGTETDKLTSWGMYDEDFNKITKQNILDLYNNNVSNVVIKSYVP